MSAVRDCHRPPFSFWEVFMRRVTAVFTTSLFLSLSAWAGAVAAPMVQAVTDQPPMVQAVEGVTPEALCDRLVTDPFAGFGPDEWSHPFSRVDYYRALSPCTKALEAHPQEQRFARSPWPWRTSRARSLTPQSRS